jgi:uncharacterized protein (TIRG00374 family)
MSQLSKFGLQSPLVRYAAGIALVLVLLFVVDVGSVLQSLAQVSTQDILLILFISFLLVWVSVLKWSLFLRELGIHTGVPRLMQLYLFGYFVNLLVPSYVGGDIARTVAAGKGGDKARAFSATFLERYTGLVAMVVMALGGLVFCSAVTPAIRLAVILVGCGTLVATLAVFLGWCSVVARRLAAPQRLIDATKRIESGMKLGLSRPTVLLKAAGLSLLFHLLTIVNTGAVGFAVGWIDIPWMDLLVVVPLILLIGAIPVSPQGLGIQEGAFLFFLVSVGATDAQAMSIGIILRAKSYLLALLGGAFWLLRDKKQG